MANDMEALGMRLGVHSSRNGTDTVTQEVYGGYVPSHYCGIKVGYELPQRKLHQELDLFGLECAHYQLCTKHQRSHRL